jgi:hypothetical protein
MVLEHKDAASFSQDFCKHFTNLRKGKIFPFPNAMGIFRNIPASECTRPQLPKLAIQRHKRAEFTALLNIFPGSILLYSTLEDHCEM